MHAIGVHIVEQCVSKSLKVNVLINFWNGAMYTVDINSHIDNPLMYVIQGKILNTWVDVDFVKRPFIHVTSLFVKITEIQKV